MVFMRGWRGWAFRTGSAAACALAAALAAGCLDSDSSRLGSYAPDKDNVAAVDLSPAAMADYLARSSLATPEVTRDALNAVRSGKTYRQRVKDQEGRGTLATVYVDPDNALHVVTFRTETCPVCQGTGTRPSPFGAMDKVSVNLRCLRCDGNKTLKNYADERRYLLSANDFTDPAAAAARLQATMMRDAGPEAMKWINALASQDPRERLAACIWLDRNFVREGVRFQTLMPMLEKNRFYEKSDEKKMMAWQFWAGLDLPGEEARVYYRVIADTRTGKVIRKGFFPDVR